MTTDRWMDKENMVCTHTHTYTYTNTHTHIQGVAGSSADKDSRRPWFDSWVRKILWSRNRLPTPVFMGFPGSSHSKEYRHNVGDWGSVPGLGRSPRGGHGNPLQYSCLEHPHGQRSLVGYSPGGSQRAGHVWAAEHSTCIHTVEDDFAIKIE